jgi:hypothetical protein
MTRDRVRQGSGDREAVRLFLPFMAREINAGLQRHGILKG